MNPEKMTVMSRQAVAEAQNEARRRSHNEVDTWHLFVALLAQEGGIVPSLVEKLGVTVSALQLAADRELERLPKVTGAVDVSKIYVTEAADAPGLRRDAAFDRAARLEQHAAAVHQRERADEPRGAVAADVAGWGADQGGDRSGGAQG